MFVSLYNPPQKGSCWREKARRREFPSCSSSIHDWLRYELIVVVEMMCILHQVTFKRKDKFKHHQIINQQQPKSK